MAPVPEQHGEFHEPSATDAVVVRLMLLKGKQLPIELVDIILDQAEYWPHESASTSQSRTIHGGNPATESALLLRIPAVGSESKIGKRQHHPADSHHEVPAHRPTSRAHPVRKIVFKIRSHDQGYSADADFKHTFQRSWTWFDAGLERPNPETKEMESIHPEKRDVPGPQGSYNHALLPSPAYTIQRNRTATNESDGFDIVYVVEWSWNDDLDPTTIDEQGRGAQTGSGEFVRDLRIGDVVTVWGHARFMAWANHVESVEARVYWAV